MNILLLWKISSCWCILLIFMCCKPSWAWQDINHKLLHTMTSYMNLSVDPCQDFYKYACGNWENLLPAKATYVDTIGSLEHKINRHLKRILEEKILKHKTKSKEVYQKVGVYYESCKEQQTFDAAEYLRVIKPTEEEEWPDIEDSWQPKKPWSVFSTLGRLQTVGFNGFMLTLETKNRNATHFQLNLDKLQDLGFTAYEQKLLDHMDSSLSIKTRWLSQNIQNFVKNLAALYRNHNQNYAVEMTVEELQLQVLHIDFRAYFSSIVGEDQLTQLPLKVANIDFYRKLGDLVGKTCPDTLIQTLKLKLLGFLEQQMPQAATPLKCLQHMRDLVPLALDYIYEQESYQHEREANGFVIHKLFKNLQGKFKNILLEHSRELSAEEVFFLENKIMLMKLNIGNLALTADGQYYSEYFASWQACEGFFYWNHVNALQHRSCEKFNMLSLKWYSPQHTYFHWPYGSPAYQPSANLLIIPHAYLQYPIFNKDFHEIFLYAELGNTLGHEMLHAFDTNGLQYDGRGNPSSLFIKNLPDKKSFMASLECLNKQKPSSLNEKIADLSGFRLAYDSLFQRATVPRLCTETHLSNKQLFFIKFAQFFCAVNPKLIHYDDTHDTPFVRVPQVVNNHAEFAEVFGCQHQSSKAKTENCNMW